jgi:hypothetical protein
VLTWTNNIQGIKASLGDNSVEVRINADKAGASPPVAQEPCFDVIVRYVALKKNIVI